LTRRDAERGRVLFAAGKVSQGVWIIRGGMVEPAVGAGTRRVVVELLHPGDVDGDVALLLTEEATDGRVRLPQRTLAAMLGVHRPSLNKVLKQFERQRLLEVGYGEIRLLDPQGLARLTA
jgi:CRP/FNR family transcriptional regulator, cAMP and macrophage regulator